MNCILTFNWKLQYQICTYYATRYFASVTLSCLGLSCLQIFANFAAELSSGAELFLSQLTLTIIYIFLLFQTGVPHYEDFISKAGKLHSHLKWVVQHKPWLDFMITNLSSYSDAEHHSVYNIKIYASILFETFNILIRITSNNLWAIQSEY